MQRDFVDEPRLDDARAEREVEQVGNADVVDEVPDGRGRRAANVVVRQSRDQRDDARLHLDRAKRIAERARKKSDVGAAHPMLRR